MYSLPSLIPVSLGGNAGHFSLGFFSVCAHGVTALPGRKHAVCENNEGKDTHGAVPGHARQDGLFWATLCSPQRATVGPSSQGVLALTDFVRGGHSALLRPLDSMNPLQAFPGAVRGGRKSVKAAVSLDSHPLWLRTVAANFVSGASQGLTHHQKGHYESLPRPKQN